MAYTNFAELFFAYFSSGYEFKIQVFMWKIKLSMHTFVCRNFFNANLYMAC